MRHLARRWLALLAMTLCAGVALGDIGPDIEVRLVSPFTAVAPGDTYPGRLEIACGQAGTLSAFAIAGEGWTAALDRAPGATAVTGGDVLEIAFTATALDPDGRLVFTCDFDGYTVRHAIDLSERNVRYMTEGIPTMEVSDFEAPPGDRSWDPADDILGYRSTEPPRDARRLVTVSGRFGTIRSDGQYLPAHSILVEIWDDDGLTGDDLMGSGYTNFDGYYEITVESTDGDIFGEPDIYATFEMVNGRIRVYEPTSGDNYVYFTGVHENYTGTTLDLGSLIPADPDQRPSVFMHTQGSRGWVHDSNLGHDVPACRIEWPSAAWPNCSPDGRIQMRNDFSWSDGTLWHEYGHWFDHELASWEPFDYCNGICDNSPTDCGHCFWCQESETIAWLEGWAQFHSWAVGVWTPVYYGNDPIAPKNAEDLGTCGGAYDDPLLTEGFIAALTQDIADGAQDRHNVYGDWDDAMAVGVGPVFSLNVLDNPTGSQDFADHFIARYPAWREPFWETAANCGYWLDTTAPGVVTNLNSTSHTAGVPSPDPTVSFTWTRAADNLSGTAGYGLYVSAGPGLPSQVMDIGNVTSYTTEALTPGTWYFNIRAVDNAGNWSGSYVWWGPIVIREPEPADLTGYLASGWDYPLVPRSTDDTVMGDCTVPATLPGDATGTYWNIFGQNQGEASTGVGFFAHLNIDGVYTQNVYWNVIGAGGLYWGPNRGPVYVPGGRHSFTTRHDATDLVAETDETNNAFGRQFIWTPASVIAGGSVTREAPPITGGWDHVTSGAIYYNADGLRMPTGTGWWHAMAVWADDDTEDVDCRLHTASTGAENGFASNLGYSASTYGYLDAVVSNRNVVGDASFDVGVLNASSGDGAYHAYHAYSYTMAFGDSITVAMGQNVPVLLREFYVGSEDFGPVSVTAACDPAEGPMYLRVLTADFTTGTLVTGPQVGYDVTDAGGLARVSATIGTSGWYGIMVFRHQTGGLAPVDVTIEVSTTPPDLAPWTPSGWHAAITPRPAPDGTSTWCPLPDTLYSSPDATYINVAATNLGPVSSPVPTRIYRNDNYTGYVNWPTVPAGWQGSYNWTHEFLFSPGRHTLALRVDALGAIEETEEGNNIRGEQWIWSPEPMAPPAVASRIAPPERTAGWSDITTGEPMWYNCDGLRLVGSVSGWWKAMAILPADGSDHDVRLHEKGSGAKDGFGASLVGSYNASSAPDYVLVDYNVSDFVDYDAGVLRFAGDGSYNAHAAASVYLGDHPTGLWGTFQVPDGGVVSMAEFHLEPEDYEVILENLSGADLGIAVHRSGDAYQRMLDAVARAEDGLGGENETVTFTVTEGEYYCFVTYRKDHGTGVAPFHLRIANSMTPVEDGGVPLRTRLAGAYPNPFNPQTTVAFDLARTDHARVVIYDVQGRAVRTLVDEELPAGRHTVAWQGRDDQGRGVASGVYFARLQADSGHGLVKLVLVK